MPCVHGRTRGPAAVMQVEPLPARGRYRLLSPLVCAVCVVPYGFEWDGASIPRAAWSVLGYTPFHPDLMRASCVHDYLYRERIGTRRAADALFRDLVIADGVPADTAALLYAAVRQFGVHTWRDAEDARHAQALDEHLVQAGEMG